VYNPEKDERFFCRFLFYWGKSSIFAENIKNMITQGSKKIGLWLFAALLICCMSLTSCSENDSSGGSSPESEVEDQRNSSE
jgi:hypothetical protein